MTWKDDVVNALNNLEKTASLEEIYQEIESIRDNLGPNYKARVRATLEENSADSDAWLGKENIFKMIEKGTGVWSFSDDFTPNVNKNYRGLYFKSLNDAIEEKGIDPADVRIVRHHYEMFADLKDYPFNLWKSNKKEFKKLNSIQKLDAFGNQKILMSFVETPFKQTILAKTYKILTQDKTEVSTGYFNYQLEEIKDFNSLEGKLRIDWGEGKRAWNQIAGNGKKIIEYDKLNSLDDLIPNKGYLRQDIHKSFGGNQQAGIVSIPRLNSIFLINSFGGSVFGYEDGWSEGVYKLSGEGMLGDQKLVKGNKLLFESIGTDKRIFLFEPAKDREPYSHILHGELRCVDYETIEGLDKDKNIRKMYKFHLQDVNHPEMKKIAQEDILKEIKDKFTEEIQEEIEEEYSNKSDRETSVSTKERSLSTEDYSTARNKVIKRTQKENKLVSEYIDVLRNEGFNTKHSQVDIVAEKENETIYIEAKILKGATTAAHGLGQILHYDFILEKKADKLALLFDKKPNDQTIKFIKQYDIEIIYKEKTSFKKI